MTVDSLHVYTRSDDWVLRVDTDISCSSASYKRFRAIDIALIGLYSAALVGLGVVVARHRSILNPAHLRDDALRYKARDSNAEVRALWFVFAAYRCEFYLFELIEM